MVVAAYASSIAARPISAGALLQHSRLDTALPRSRRPRDRLRIALLAPLSGPAGLWGPSCQTSAELAAREVNESGGVLGRELELRFIDGGRSPQEVTDETLDLITSGGAEAVIGMHISAVRQALVRALRGRIPYVYTPVYEGGESAPGVFMVGETPALQLKPSIEWLTERRGARRWYFIGNDYVWPHVSHRAADRYVAANGGTVVGECYVPFGCEDYETYLDGIRKASPDAVLVSMVGSDCVAFNRAFADSGLDRHILRLSAASEENTLLGIGAENARNLFFAAGYLAGLKTPENLAFLDRYHAAFGADAPVPNTIGESCYEGVRLYSELARRAGSLDIETLGRASEGLSYIGARGRSHMLGRHLHTDIYLAEADGLDFRIVQHFPGG
jgi:urea transport system substrate-binding protein